MSKSDRIDVYLVAGGKYHNIDHARLEILKLLAEQLVELFRTTLTGKGAIDEVVVEHDLVGELLGSAFQPIALHRGPVV